MNRKGSSEVLSLDVSKQKDVVQETKQLKKKIKDGTITIKEAKKALQLKAEQNKGLLFISHLPHGFYEEELRKYFGQFGKVTNVKVCRSRRTGNSKGYGYVEFSNPNVAKIAAETMNNYLMFKKRITAVFVPCEKRPKYLFVGKGNTPTRFSSQVRRNKQHEASLRADPETHERKKRTRLSKLKKKLTTLQNLGVKTTFTPIDVTLIKQEGNSIENLSHTLEADQYDTDEEIKGPFRPSNKRVQSVRSLPNTVSAKSKKSTLDSPKSNVSLDSPSLKQKRNKKQSKGINKKSKKQPLNSETVRKIARELIRKRGDTLLTFPADLSNKTKIAKKKSVQK